jgi:hypothetical protein
MVTRRYEQPEASLAIGRGLPGRLRACPVEPQVAGGLSGERAYVRRVGCARPIDLVEPSPLLLGQKVQISNAPVDLLRRAPEGNIVREEFGQDADTDPRGVHDLDGTAVGEHTRASCTDRSWVRVCSSLSGDAVLTLEGRLSKGRDGFRITMPA